MEYIWDKSKAYICRITTAVFSMGYIYTCTRRARPFFGLLCITLFIVEVWCKNWGNQPIHFSFLRDTYDAFLPLFYAKKDKTKISDLSEECKHQKVILSTATLMLFLRDKTKNVSLTYRKSLYLELRNLIFEIICIVSKIAQKVSFSIFGVKIQNINFLEMMRFLTRKFKIPIF